MKTNKTYKTVEIRIKFVYQLFFRLKRKRLHDVVRELKKFRINLQKEMQNYFPM